MTAPTAAVARPRPARPARIAEARTRATITHHVFMAHYATCVLACADGGLCMTGEELGREADDAGNALYWLEPAQASAESWAVRR